MERSFNKNYDLLILYLEYQDLNKHPKEIVPKSRKFNPQDLMNHEIFKISQPILIGGGALALHHHKMKSKKWMREIDDLDFYVTNKLHYDMFKNKRKIDMENKENQRLHFFEKMGDNYFIRITICFMKEWENKRYERLYGMRCLNILELKKNKTIDPNFTPFDDETCEKYKRNNSSTQYFIRKLKKEKDMDDIYLINILLYQKEVSYNKGGLKIKNKVHNNNYYFLSHHGTYLSANVNNMAFLTKNKKEWEKWTLINLGNGKYAFKSCHQTYLRANKNKSVDLSKNRQAWEEWTINKINGKLVIRSAQWGTYLSARDNGEIKLMDWAKDWEMFIKTK